MSWDGMAWDGVGWDGMGWDIMAWDGMGWDVMAWEGMGWNGVGRECMAIHARKMGRLHVVELIVAAASPVCICASVLMCVSYIYIYNV